MVTMLKICHRDAKDNAGSGCNAYTDRKTTKRASETRQLQVVKPVYGQENGDGFYVFQVLSRFVL